MVCGLGMLSISANWNVASLELSLSGKFFKVL